MTAHRVQRRWAGDPHRGRSANRMGNWCCWVIASTGARDRCPHGAPQHRWQPRHELAGPSAGLGRFSPMDALARTLLSSRTERLSSLVTCTNDGVVTSASTRTAPSIRRLVMPRGQRPVACRLRHRPIRPEFAAVSADGKIALGVRCRDSDTNDFASVGPFRRHFRRQL